MKVLLCTSFMRNRFLGVRGHVVQTSGGSPWGVADAGDCEQTRTTEDECFGTKRRGT